MNTGKAAFAFAAAGAIMAGLVRADGPKKGLFADDGKDVKTGDVRNLDYWFLKFDVMTLEDALKTRQPEGMIGVQCGSMIRSADDLIKLYPNHQDLKKWRARAQEINEKIDPDAPRSGSWKKGCAWNDGDYREAWASYGAGKTAYADKEWDEAELRLRFALEKFAFVDKRLENFSEETQAWIKEAEADARKLHRDAKNGKR